VPTEDSRPAADELAARARQRLVDAERRLRSAEGRLNETLLLLETCTDPDRRFRLEEEAARHREAAEVHRSAIGEQRMHLRHLTGE